MRLVDVVAAVDHNHAFVKTRARLEACLSWLLVAYVLDAVVSLSRRG